MSFYSWISWLIHVQDQTLDLLASTLLLQFVFVFSLQARMVIDETNGYTRGGEKRGYSRMRQRLHILLRDAWSSRAIFGFESICEDWCLRLFLKALESPTSRLILLLEVRYQSRWIQKQWEQSMSMLWWVMLFLNSNSRSLWSFDLGRTPGSKP